MARNRKPADELSIEELESLLARKKLQARQDRVRKFRRSGRAVSLQPDPNAELIPDSQLIDFDEDEQTDRSAFRRRVGGFFRFLLLLTELAAVGALVFIVYRGYVTVQELNAQADTGIVLPTPSATPLITAVVLPSGHTPPTDPGGARPNVSEIPENLRPLVQSLASIPIPTPGPEQAYSIFIPALWVEPAPVVQGERARACTGKHQKATGDGDVLHEGDHLHLIARLPMEQQRGEHGEAGKRQRRPARPKAHQHEKAATQLSEDDEGQQNARYAALVHVGRRAFIARDLVETSLDENDHQQHAADKFQIRRRRFHLDPPPSWLICRLP